MHLPFGSVALCALFAISVPSVRAQDEASPDASDDAVARELFEAGQLSADRGDYQRALELFQESFELSDRPVLLFNAGNAAERLRNDDLAIELYSSYLERLPEAGNREAVERRLERLRRLVAEAQTTETPAETLEEGRRTNVWAWLSGSVVVAFTALGIVARVQANQVFADLENECGNPPGCTDERLHGSSVDAWDRTTVLGFAIAGAGAISLVLSLILGKDDADQAESESQTRVDVGPTGVLVRGTF